MFPREEEKCQLNLLKMEQCSDILTGCAKHQGHGFNTQRARTGPIVYLYNTVLYTLYWIKVSAI